MIPFSKPIVEGNKQFCPFHLPPVGKWIPLLTSTDPTVIAKFRKYYGNTGTENYSLLGFCSQCHVLWLYGPEHAGTFKPPIIGHPFTQTKDGKVILLDSGVAH